jgi:NAD(P)-dependent dehydrogenase (short-subunit alcohol dehydrogenase family)
VGTGAGRALGDRVGIVTGAGRGIGAAVAEALAADGAHVVGVDIEPAGATENLRADLSDPRDAATVVPAALQRYGRLDFLVNNAGLARHSPAAEISLAELDLMWAVNARATIQLTRDAFKVMARPQGRGGQIVNVISTAGLAGQPGESAYCATKFAVRGFTEAVAEEGRPVGVRVHGIYPAGVATRFWNDAVPDPGGFIGAKEFLSPGDVAAAVRYLLSLPDDVDLPCLALRHVSDTDLDAIRAKLDSVSR